MNPRSRTCRASIAVAALAFTACGDPDVVPRDARAALDAARDAPPLADARAPDGDGPAGDAPLPADYARLGTVRRDGDTVTLRTHPTVNYRGIDAAYDPARRVFLVVYGNAPIGGAVLDDEGRQVGDGVRLTDAPYTGENFTQLPRVAYGEGAFVVTWHAAIGRSVEVHARRVRVDAGGAVAFDGPAAAVSGLGSNQESPASIAFSAATREFLVVWAQNGIKARRLGSDGAPRGEVLTVSTDGTWAEQPSVVYHPGARAFFVAFSQVVPPDGARVALARVEDGTGRVMEAPRDLTGTVAFTKVTDVALDETTGEVIASWFESRAGTMGFGAQRLRGDGAAAGEARAVFRPFGSYDGYDLAWSAATGTSLGVFHGESVDVSGAELDRALVNTAPGALTATGARSGTFIPRVVAHPTRPWWLVFGAADYARVVVQRVVREPVR